MLEWASTKGSKSVEFQSLLCELKYQKDYGYSVVFDTQRPYVRFWKSAGVHRVFNRPDDDDDDDDLMVMRDALDKLTKKLVKAFLGLGHWTVSGTLSVFFKRLAFRRHNG